MRIEFENPLPLEREVFAWLARALHVNEELPAVRRDGLFLFGEPELVIQLVPVDRSELAGDYSCGKMRIFNCPRCTAGRRIWAFAHELVHAWYESYSWDRYFFPEVEHVASRFADEVVRFLGGSIGEENDCGTYWIPSEAANRLKDEGALAAVQAIFEKSRLLD